MDEKEFDFKLQEELFVGTDTAIAFEKSAKETFKRVGWSFFAFLLAVLLTQFTVGGVYAAVIETSGISIDNPLLNEFINYFLTLIPMYVVGLPLLRDVLKPVPKTEIKGEKFGFFKMLKYFLISLPVMYLGNFISLFFAGLVERFTGKTAVNNISELIVGSNPWLLILFVVIIGPIIEEIIFRKILIDRTVRFGEKNAVILSAIMFGLFHMNLFQFFYATALGLIFGYMYVRSGKLRYTIFLHMIINFMGSVVAVFMSGNGEESVLKMIQEGRIEQIPAEQFMQLVILSVYSVFVLLASIVGVILILLNIRKIKWETAEVQIEKKKMRNFVYGNLGIAFFFALCIVMMLATTFMQLQ